MKFKVNSYTWYIWAIILTLIINYIGYFFIDWRSILQHTKPSLFRNTIQQPDSFTIMSMERREGNLRKELMEDISNTLLFNINVGVSIDEKIPGYKKKTNLPAFTINENDFILSSMIERSSNSWDLYLTTFMLCHSMLAEDDHNTVGVESVHPVMKDKWSRAMNNFKKTTYMPSGVRNQKYNEEYYCSIKHFPSSTAYIVPGVFMPNRLTADRNSNRKLDILRCPMKNSKYSYYNYIDTNFSISVDILRGNGNNSMISFTIPWKTRKTGYLLSTPPSASKLDAWKGYDKLLKRKPTTKKLDKLHICLPSSNVYPSKNLLPVFLEFISHHLLVGASHIHLPVQFGWNSIYMQEYLTIFKSYIDEGEGDIIAYLFCINTEDI